MDRPDLSLVIACFNEAKHLVDSVARIVDICDGLPITYEMLFVDDCSTDDTREILTALQDRYSSHAPESELRRATT